MSDTDDVIKCRKCATQMLSSYGREARNDQSNRRIGTTLLSKWNLQVLGCKQFYPFVFYVNYVPLSADSTLLRKDMIDFKGIKDQKIFYISMIIW